MGCREGGTTMAEEAPRFPKECSVGIPVVVKVLWMLLLLVFSGAGENLELSFGESFVMLSSLEAMSKCVVAYHDKVVRKALPIDWR